MAEDDERREGSKRAGRRDPARTARRDPPILEGQAEDVTPPVDAVVASGEMMEAPAVESEHPNAVRPDVVAPDAEPTHPVGSAEQDAASQPEAVHKEPLTTTAAVKNGSRWGTLAAIGFVVLAAGILYLFTQLSAVPPDTSAAVANLKAQVAALQARPATNADGLAERLNKLEQTEGNTRTALDGMSKHIDGVAAALAAQPNVSQQVTDLQSGLSSLKSEIADLKSSIAALPRPDISRLEARIGDLDQRFSGLQSAVSSIPHIDLGPVTSKVDQLEARLKPVEAETAQARSPEQAAQRRAAPIAVTAQAIIDAIETAQPFTKDLQVLQTLGVSQNTLAPLQAVADTGAPSVRSLQSTLADMSDRIIASGTAPTTGSYVDRLVAGASSLVQVRPIGSVVGDTAGAIVARMNAEIGNDDLGAALADWHKLPEGAQAVSKPLVDRITMRRDALAAARTIASDAIASMAAPRG